MIAWSLMLFPKLLIMTRKMATLCFEFWKMPHQPSNHRQEPHEYSSATESLIRNTGWLCHLHGMMFFVRTLFNREKTSDKAEPRLTPQNNWLLLLKNVSITEAKGRLMSCHRPEETRIHDRQSVGL